jgi:arylsulfatase A-like enzyme
MKNNKPITFISLSVLFLITSFLRAESDDRPNILFISVDDLNDWIGPLGGHPQAKTPNIDRLAKRGVLFTNAHCQIPLCNPSRTSVLTGEYPHNTGIYYLKTNFRESPVLKESVTLPQYFKESGYTTYAVGKVFHINPDYPTSWSVSAGGNRNSGEYGPSLKKDDRLSCDDELSATIDPLFDWGVFSDGIEKMPDMESVNWANKMVFNEEQSNPFFLAVGLYRPHLPFYAPQEFFNMYPLDGIQLPATKLNDLEDLSENILKKNSGGQVDHNSFGWNFHRFDWVEKNDQWKQITQAYLASVSFADHCIGLLLDNLEKSKYADNTIIVLWSDHGYHVGEKRVIGKFDLWEESTKVPLIFAGKDLLKGKVASDPVGLIDLYPTLVGLADLPISEKLDGRDLSVLLKYSKFEWNTPVLTTVSIGNHSVRDRKWRFSSYDNGDEELYDIEDDPNCFVNLAGNAIYKKQVERLKKYIPKNEYPMLYKPGSHLKN